MLGGDNRAPCIYEPRGSSRRIEGLEADEKVDFMLAMFSLTLAAAQLLVQQYLSVSFLSVVAG